MLESIPWDVVAFVAGVIGMFLVYRWRRQQMIQDVLDKLQVYATPIANVVITFWRDCPHEPPTVAELNMIIDCWDAARRAWPDLADELDDVKYNIWLVRSPEQPVGWRQYGGIAWKDVPDVVFIPESSEGQGYGGMSDRKSSSGTMYIATYFPDRAPLKLLAHEMTHCVKPIRGHTSEFVDYERRLLGEL